MSEKIESYALQVLFYVIYLTLVVVISHIIVDMFNIKNITLNALSFFSLYCLACIYGKNKFVLLTKKFKYLILFIPLILLLIFASF